MKVFIYSGSKNPNSKSNDFMNLVANKFKLDPEIDLIFRTPLDTKIDESKGINNNSDSYMIEEKIKKELLNSDIFIFCSPVYLHNVSGSSKNFLDSLVEWSHTMALSGKLGIVVSVSSSNGNDFVNHYLSKVLRYMGVTILSSFEISQKDYPNQEIYNIVTRKKADNIVSIVKKSYEFGVEVSEKQETIFRTYKSMLNKKGLFTSHEEKELKQQKFDKMNSFQELFNTRFKGGI